MQKTRTQMNSFGMHGDPRVRLKGSRLRLVSAGDANAEEQRAAGRAGDHEGIRGEWSSSSPSRSCGQERRLPDATDLECGSG